jgi:hypothetical protein
MKKCFVAVGIGVLGLSLLGMPAIARGEDDEGDQPRREKRQNRERSEKREKGEGRPRDRAGKSARDGRRRGGRLVKLLRSFNLAPEEEARVRQILETHHQAVQNWRSENKSKFKEIREQVRSAREAKDREAMKAAREEMKGLMDSRKALHEDLLEQLDDVLDEEQMARVKQLSARPPMGPAMRACMRMAGAARRLGLSDEQKESVRGILRAAKADAVKTDSPEAKEQIWEAAFEKIRNEILTEQQRARLQEMKQRRERGDRPGRDRGKEHRRHKRGDGDKPSQKSPEEGGESAEEQMSA